MQTESRDTKRIVFLGVPSSAGARRGGQQRAPRALRDAGIVANLAERGLSVLDRGDTTEAVFRRDVENPRCQNLGLVARVVREVAAEVAKVDDEGDFLLVLGGDCTITLGVVAGQLCERSSLGLVYFDADLDLNTPATTPSGVFEGMVAAHLLGRGASELSEIGARAPLVDESRFVFFGYDIHGGGIDPPELTALSASATSKFPVEAIRRRPAETAYRALSALEPRVDRFLVHFDVDVTDTTAVDLPHSKGLPLTVALEALRVFVASPKCVGLIVTELNPELDADEVFTRQLAAGLAESMQASWPRRQPLPTTGLRVEESVGGVILGGTELPLLIREPVVGGVPCLDTSALHVEAMLEEMPRESSLSVRAMQPDDVPALVEYWTHLTPADVARMGVDAGRLPTPEELGRSLLELCRIPEGESPTAYSIWEVDGRPIGHASLKNFRRGGSGEIHLHIWNVAARGKGYGARLFAMSALDFYERFALTRLVCEPKVDNPLPNRMLSRAGFPRIGRRVGASSELSVVCDLNVYAIERRTAEMVLARIGSAGLGPPRSATKRTNGPAEILHVDSSTDA